MSFLFLKNLGTPTSWDGTDYFGYRLSIIDKLSPALKCMTSDERYEPGGLDSFWNSWVTNAGFDGENLQLDFFNPANNKLFSFRYFGVRRIRSDYRDLRGKPSMAVQECAYCRESMSSGTPSSVRSVNSWWSTRRQWISVKRGCIDSSARP